MLAIAKVSSSVFEVPTGVFSDFVGRRVTILTGQAANIAAIAAYAAAPGWIGKASQARHHSWQRCCEDASFADAG